MIFRKAAQDRVTTALRRSPVAALLGPRQCGKTTLARQIAAEAGGDGAYYDLESPSDVARLQNPELALAGQGGLVVIDEIQRMPELFNILRSLVDRQSKMGRYLILGSASPDLVRGVSQSLAGRVEFVELTPFDLEELSGGVMNQLWLRGGFPRSYLAASEDDSFAWREGYLRTFLERDIPQLGISIPAPALRRFWTMLAHYHGQTWNASEIARSMGMTDKTIRGYLDLLTGTYMLRQLQPWHENVAKRQVKAPKIYFRDTGILHSLLSLPSMHALTGHPRLGASWEGFVMEQLLRLLNPGEAYFWATHQGTELDLLLFSEGRRYGVEIKYNEAPTVTKSMRIAMEDLRLEHLWLVYPGERIYAADERITMIPVGAAEEIRGGMRL